MAGERTYIVPPQSVKDFQTAYDALFVAEDIAAKFREAGEPDMQKEAVNAAQRTKMERYAAAFGIPLE